MSGNDSRLSELFLSRSTIEEQYGDYKNALLNMKNYVNLRDSMYRKSKSRLAEELLANHAIEVQELELAKQSASIQELKSQRFLTALLLVLVVVILFAALAFYQKRMAVQKLKLAQSETEKAATALSLQKAEVEQLQMKSDLEYKKRELSQLALYINEQHEFLESIKTKIHQQETGNIQSIEKELQLNLAIGKQRQAFDLNIDLINNEFYKNLKSRFPALTASELRLCAMLKLQLSSKEMASVLNISAKSVDMNRYRLRKKLQLEGETDLVAFLQELG
jgi:DNA-binding CsgD family transcriptional regulator